MYSSRRRNTEAEILGFTYPKLHTGKDWFVDFFAFDPVMESMRRKRYYLNNVKKISERRKKAAEIIEALLRQLRAGWNPWVSTTESRAYTLIEDCFEKYLLHISRFDRKKTIMSYTSRLNILREYISTLTIKIKYVYQYDSVFVTDFLDWIYLDRESSPKTVNNYRAWCYALGEFFISRKYISENPVDKIKPMKENEKKRKDLSEHQLKEMRAYLENEDPHFLLACYMEYFMFIRPTELTYIQIKHISLKEQRIFISGSYSKNHRDAYVGLNNTILKLMIKLGTFDAPSDYYLFGKNFMPNEKRMGADRFNKRWVKMREALNWKDCYQFYSLKDSGIRDLANAEGVVVARDQARHQDITTTNKYIQAHGMKVHEETKTFEGLLSDDVNPNQS